jgi:acid phosphatase type 7
MTMPIHLVRLAALAALLLHSSLAALAPSPGVTSGSGAQSAQQAQAPKAKQHGSRHAQRIQPRAHRASSRHQGGQHGTHGSRTTRAAPTTLAPTGAQPGAVTLLAAGDIGSCPSPSDEQTAALITHLDGAVATLGDNAYRSGSTAEFRQCYDPSWGKFKDRTHPAPGNHDYDTAGASGYFGYFGAAAGDPGKGYYSYDLGTWHLIVLNSNCDAIGGCDAGSPQGQWLRADLAAHPATCTLAYWHHPLFTSGNKHGPDVDVRPFWEALFRHGVDVVLTGHEHNYERFAPQDPNGAADPKRGIREFVVGTGGAELSAFGQPAANSEVRIPNTYGILKLQLGDGGYRWNFLKAPSGQSRDQGSGSCHGAGAKPGAAARARGT